MRDSFSAKVLELVKKIPAGRISAYGLIAAKLGYGSSIAARAVGRALHNNPAPVTVPCHRVVKSNGEIGGYSSSVAAKKKLLSEEGITIIGSRVAGRDMASKLFSFK
jgi:methylated-DNA-[protein]-cysteine S-methyltransferase